MTPIRRLFPRLLAMVLSALVLAWGLTEFAPPVNYQSHGAVKAALVLSGSTTPLIGPILSRLLNAQRN